MNYDLVAKMHVNKWKNYLEVRGLKISGHKNELVALVFSAMENNVMSAGFPKWGRLVEGTIWTKWPKTA